MSSTDSSHNKGVKTLVTANIALIPSTQKTIGLVVEIIDMENIFTE